MASTAELTVGQAHILPGQHSEPRVHGGDESLYLVRGVLHLLLPENEGQQWFELKPGDGFYIPEGTPHQYYNLANESVELLFGVAPRYLPA